MKDSTDGPLWDKSTKIKLKINEHNFNFTETKINSAWQNKSQITC